MITLYGIKNCNTVKTALDWLAKNKVDVAFHDYKKSGVTRDLLKAWSSQVGWERLLNRKGLTWRQLDETIREQIKSEDAALELMEEKTSVIKRPLIVRSGKIVALGFDEEVYRKAFK